MKFETTYCPECGMQWKLRDQGLNGNDTCMGGHVYPTNEAVSFEEACKRARTKRKIKFREIKPMPTIINLHDDNLDFIYASEIEGVVEWDHYADDTAHRDTKSKVLTKSGKEYNSSFTVQQIKDQLHEV